MLTDEKIENAEIRAAPYKIFDSRGLHLHVSSTGAKSFRYKYRLNGHEGLITLGRYPYVNLEEARQRLDYARTQVSVGQKPTGWPLSRPVVPKRNPLDLALIDAPPGSVVYFLRSASGHIKIGVTSSLEKRMRDIQASNSQLLELICQCPGGYFHESALHTIFGAERGIGEWFLPSPELLHFIGGIIETGGWPC